jgi:hypothetical protein
VLAKLLGWVNQPVSVTITPAFDGAMQVAGMAGLLQRGSAPPEMLTDAMGQAGEVLFFFVGEDQDWKRRWFRADTRAFSAGLSLSDANEHGANACSAATVGQRRRFATGPCGLSPARHRSGTQRQA